MTDLDHFAQEFAFGFSQWLDKQHEIAIRRYYGSDDCPELEEEARTWGRLADDAAEADIETNDALFDRGVWVASERKAA